MNEIKMMFRPPTWYPLQAEVALGQAIDAAAMKIYEFWYEWPETVFLLLDHSRDEEITKARAHWDALRRDVLSMPIRSPRIEVWESAFGPLQVRQGEACGALVVPDYHRLKAVILDELQRPTLGALTMHLQDWSAQNRPIRDQAAELTRRYPDMVRKEESE